jgi:hypothetical protein
MSAIDRTEREWACGNQERVVSGSLRPSDWPTRRISVAHA